MADIERTAEISDCGSNWHDDTNVIHDHFDGSAHCIECHGRCNLTGGDDALTYLVRSMFEAWALYAQQPNAMTCGALRGHLGINLEAALARAKEASR